MKSQYLRKMIVVFALVFFSILSTVSVEAQNMFRKVLDFDGDGRADYAVTRNENNRKVWYVWQSTEGFKAVQWGLSADHNAAGDYDGDGKTDFAIYRDPTGFPPKYTFWVWMSQTNALFYKEFSAISNFGSAPMHQDYNGDGKTDAAVWLGSEFGPTSLLISNTGESGITGGASIPRSDIPIRVGDIDGNDGRADIAHYRSSDNLVTIRNSMTNSTRNIQWGLFGDRFQSADFDGDGFGDLTIWRSSDGNWWWIRSSDNTVNTANWGIDGDTPVPADYDGDGKTDLAIWRGGFYWINGSLSGVSVFNWGLSTDTPVRY